LNNVKIIPAEDFGISREDFSEASLMVADTLMEGGYEAYIVGGCNRDLILGLKPKDFDVSTNASPEQVRKLFKDCRIVGRRFRIAHVRHKREIIEVSTFRGDPKEKQNANRNEMREGKEGQLIRDNVYGTLDSDAFRRDFTVNALYYNAKDNTLSDFMDSVGDLKSQTLKVIGDEQARFTEDPVRMLRMVRFSAKLGFPIPQESLALIQEQAGLLTHVSAPRMFEEVLKLFHSGQAFSSFELLREYGLFKTMFPFTAQHLDDGEVGMTEKALKNTDQRIRAGKPVISAFLFACLLWDPIREDAQILMDSGEPHTKAWKMAMMDAIRDQSQYVALPRRIADIMMEIWMLQFRMVKRQPASISQLMSNRRFRAAYDFMLLRSQLAEVDTEIADWWTDIQELERDGQKEMIADLMDDSDEEDDDEPNFNTFHHANQSSTANGNGQHRRNNNGGRNGGQKNGAKRHSRRKPAGASSARQTSK